MLWLSIFGFKAITMATSHVMMGRYIPCFGPNFLIFHLWTLKWYYDQIFTCQFFERIM